MRKAPLLTPFLALALSSLLAAETFSTFSEVHDPSEAWSFGWSLDMSGDTLAVGDNDPRSGSVWIFERHRGKPSRFRLAKRLASPTPEDARFFGRRMKLDGDTLVVAVAFSNSVLVFSRDHGGPGAWGFVKRIEGYGDVAVDGDLLATAIEGDRVEIYQRDLGGADNWGHLATVRPRDSDDPFAFSLSLSGATLVVGSAYAGCGSFSDVCSYGYRVFEQSVADPTRWVQTFHKPGKGRGDYTGMEVLVDGPAVVSTDGIRERRRVGWELVAPAPTGRNLSGLALRRHSVAHWGPGPGLKIVAVDRKSGLDPAWRPIGELTLEVHNCDDRVFGPRELVVACPHDNENRDHGTVRIYPREPLFSHGFEQPRLSRWSRTRGKLRLTSPGLVGSDQALAVDLDGGRRAFVRTRSLDRAPSVSLGFSLDPAAVWLAGQRVDLVHLSGHGERQAKLTMKAVDGKYRLDLWARQPGSGFVKVGGTRIPADRTTRVGIDWHRASGPSRADGSVRLTRRGRVVAERHDLATDRNSISVLTLGLVAVAPGSQGGTLLFDAVSVHR